MLFSQYVLVKKGDVNGIFGIVPKTDYRFEGAAEMDEKTILEAFRYDREKNLYGPLVPDANPSLDPSVVTHLYRPSMEKQLLYKGPFPVEVGTYQIIDAFVCIGSRFGLHTLQVFVEVCKNKCGGGYPYWANVYYVADPQVPACTIVAESYDLFLDRQGVKRSIELDEATEARLIEQAERMEKEEAAG